MPPHVSPPYITIELPLPPRCEPANDLLHFISTVLSTCIPTNLALFSTLLGSCSILSWLFAQLPQIYKNHSLKSTSGLSVFFLAEWLLGDATNLLGCLFTGQASWQIIIATYYVFVDCCLCSQWVWYEMLHHGRPLRPVFGTWNSSPSAGSPDHGIVVEHSDDSSQNKSSGTRQSFQGRRVTTSRSPTPTPSPGTFLYLSLLLVLASHSAMAASIKSSLPPLPRSSDTLSVSLTSSNAVEIAGKIFSWMSTILYLGSRLPQLYKNQIRKSTAGLSPTLFAAAFFGNLFYSTSLLSNPCAWHDYAPGEGSGWVGVQGSARKDWLLRATPFFLGAAGVLIMDAAVGLQFVYFGDNEPRGRSRSLADNNSIIITVDHHGRPVRRRLHWRRVHGWMRGWAPAVNVAATPSVSRTPMPTETPATSPPPTTSSKSIPIKRNSVNALDEARALLGTSRHASPRHSYGALYGSPRSPAR